MRCERIDIPVPNKPSSLENPQGEAVATAVDEGAEEKEEPESKPEPIVNLPKIGKPQKRDTRVEIKMKDQSNA